MLEIQQLSSTSVIGFGCSGLGARLSSNDSLRLLHAAAEGGINYIDVARSYGYGQAESVVARLLDGRRDRFFVVSKAGVRPTALAPGRRLAVSIARPVIKRIPRARGVVSARANATLSAGFSVHDLSTSLHESLTALGTDHLDVLMLHECGPADLTEEIRFWADGIVAQGKARAWGVATNAASTAEILSAQPPFTAFAPFSPQAMNLPSSASDPNEPVLRVPGPRLRAIHSVIGGDLRMVLSHLASAGARAGTGAGSWSDRLGVAPTPDALTTLLLQVARTRNPLGVVLAGTQRLEHVPALIAAGAGMPAPEQVAAVGELVAAAASRQLATRS